MPPQSTPRELWSTLGRLIGDHQRCATQRRDASSADDAEMGRRAFRVSFPRVIPFGSASYGATVTVALREPEGFWARSTATPVRAY
jgi:hypothetical protein